MGCGADTTILDRCKSAILKVDPTAEVILFGSRARGEAEEDSDYDLLILTDGEDGPRRARLFLDKIFPVEIETGAVISFILRSRARWNAAPFVATPFHRNVEREGLRL